MDNKIDTSHFRRKGEIVFAAVLVAFSLFLIFIPTGFQRAIYVNAEGARAKVLATDDSTVIQTGLFRQGDQRCTVEVLSGSHKGLVMAGVNMLSGSLANDKIFRPGEIAWVLVERDMDDNPIFINMIDHCRLGKELAAALLFSALIIAFARFSGVRTMISFAFAFLCIWKLLVPCALSGINPLLISIATLMLITIVTLLLVGGVALGVGIGFSFGVLGLGRLSGFAVAFAVAFAVVGVLDCSVGFGYDVINVLRPIAVCAGLCPRGLGGFAHAHSGVLFHAVPFSRWSAG